MHQHLLSALLKDRQQLLKRVIRPGAEKLALALHYRRRPAQILHGKAAHWNLMYRRLPLAADGIRPRIIRPHKRAEPHLEHTFPSFYP